MALLLGNIPPTGVLSLLDKPKGYWIREPSVTSVHEPGLRAKLSSNILSSIVELLCAWSFQKHCKFIPFSNSMKLVIFPSHLTDGHAEGQRDYVHL